MNQDIPEQPEILLQLRQKAAELRKIHSLEKQKNKNLVTSLTKYSEQLSTYLKQKQIQERKQKSLMLLVNDIQRQIDDLHGGIQAEDIEEETMLGEAKLLRQMLIKTAERANENQKMLSFLRQAAASGPKAQQFVYRSKYLEGQTQLLAKLKSQISSFQNPNLQCSRKWSQLARQTIRLNKQQGFMRIQLERLKTQLRDHYEEYLQSLNRSKASLVNFNQTQRERIITEHLVEEIALLQESRQGIQEQFKNLKHHQQALLQENARLQMQNRQLRSFFIGPTGEEEHKLASKMRTRIEQLRDCLAEAQRIRCLPQLPVSNLAQTIRSRHKGLQETIAFLQKKIRQEQQGKSSLDEKQIISFFQGVLRNRDERLQITKQRQLGGLQRLKQLKIRKQLLQNQIESLKQWN